MIVLSNKYNDLYSLIDTEAKARKYYDSLPEYVKDQISQNAYGVNSIESLKDYAENLLRGDD